MIPNVSGKNFTAFGRGWAKIWGKCRGGIWLLPSEATAAIVQYHPELRISAVLPAKTRTVYSDYYKTSTRLHPFELKTPTLLWSHLLYQRISCQASDACWCACCRPELKKHHLHCYCETCFKHKGELLKLQPKTSNYLNHYSIFEYQESSQGISAFALKIANVDGSGRVCFGRNYPSNLRKANSLFWAAPFNNDYGYQKPVAHTRCLAKKHYYGSAHFFGQHQTHRPNCVKELNHPCNCPRKKENIHLVKCSCYKSCSCTCICLCCLGKCQCKCSCICCRGVCNCGCTCDLNTDFIQLLKMSVEDRKAPFYDHTQTFCGKSFVATNRPADGVFISFESDLLAECKSSKSKLGGPMWYDDPGKECLIGFASRSADGQWIVDLQNETLALEDTEVYVL